MEDPAGQLAATVQDGKRAREVAHGLCPQPAPAQSAPPRTRASAHSAARRPAHAGPAHRRGRVSTPGWTAQFPGRPRASPRSGSRCGRPRLRLRQADSRSRHQSSFDGSWPKVRWRGTAAVPCHRTVSVVIEAWGMGLPLCAVTRRPEPGRGRRKVFLGAHDHPWSSNCRPDSSARAVTGPGVGPGRHWAGTGTGGDRR